MPQGPSELHRKFGDDATAWQLLKERGYTEKGGMISVPNPEYVVQPDEQEAINYLVYEWDWGIVPRNKKAPITDARLGIIIADGKVAAVTIIEPGSGYTEVAAIRVAREAPKIRVFVSGGVVNDVFTTVPGVECEVIDLDNIKAGDPETMEQELDAADAKDTECRKGVGQNWHCVA